MEQRQASRIDCIITEESYKELTSRLHTLVLAMATELPLNDQL